MTRRQRFIRQGDGFSTQSKSLEQRVNEAVKEEISIALYDPKWPELFEKEAALLRSLLPESVIVRIDHFGSTAVYGLAAKPIVDMLVQVSSLGETRKRVVPILEKQGYDYFWRTDVSPPYAFFIKRDFAGKRTHHIHMVETDSGVLESLYLRDYLREFPEEAERYANLKQLLAKEYRNDRIAYTKGKAEYLATVTELAKRRYRFLSS